MRSIRRTAKLQEAEHYWPSFTDIMSSLVLVLFFFIVILSVKQIFSSGTWDKKLKDASLSLASSRQELERTNQELSIKKQELEDLEKLLSDKEAQISILESQLTSDQEALSVKEIELNAVRNQLQQISLLRLDLLKEVKASIESELKDVIKTNGEPLVSIDNNANLVIQSSLLFAKGSSEISESGKRMLRKFALAFEKILSNSSNRDKIDSIIVSGYADSDDTFQNNYFLSCERAIAVINTMMEQNPDLENKYGRFFQASGFSEFRPLVEEVNEAAKSKNRRIQISIDIKDSQIQKIISDYMSGTP